MKTKYTPVKRAAVAALLLGLAPALVAESSAEKRNSAQQQSQNAQGSKSSQNQGSMQLRQAPEDPRGRNASELIGMDVIGSNGEQLGNVHDFIIDSQSGKIAHLVVASGGVLGIGSDLRPVPIAACNAGGDRVTLAIDQAKWEQAPVFTKDQFASLSQDSRSQEIYQFYGQKQPGQSQKNQQFALVSDLRGKEVRTGNQQVGEIDDVIVQLQSRTVAALLDPNDDFAGTDQKYIVPVSKLNNLQQDTLRTSLTRDDFSQATQTSDASWSDSTTGYVSSLYIWPIYDIDGRRNTASTSSSNRDGDMSDSRSQAGTNQGQAPIEAVRRAVQAETPRGQQQEIKVVAEKDKLVLRGTVQSEEVKERIENRAENAAEGWDVESELRVASTR